MKVLIADKFDQAGIDELDALGFLVVADATLGPDTLPGAIAQHTPDVLVVRSTKVPAQVFEKPGDLALIVRAGAGVDNIDVEAASAKGISVANCPGKNSIAVAELTWGLILACDRRIPDQAAELREGKWSKKEYSKARGLFGRTLGVIGAGQIAREVIRRAHAFGIPVVCWSRSLDDRTARELGVTRAPDAVSVAKASDVVTIHVAATPQTRHLVNKEFCDALQPGAFLINTTRGSVVDEAALLEAVRSKGVRAGLDVYENEPGSGSAEDSFQSELASAPGVYGTHHIGASTDQSQKAIADEAVRIVRSFRETGEIPNVVNICSKTVATNLLVVRHLNRPGVLAHVVGAIGRAGINIEDMENVIYDGEEAACARISLAGEPGRDVMDEINRGSPHVLSVDLATID